MVLPGARAQGGGGAPHPGPVEDVGPAGVLGPAAQALLEVALELWSWGDPERCFTSGVVNGEWSAVIQRFSNQWPLKALYNIA